MKPDPASLGTWAPQRLCRLLPPSGSFSRFVMLLRLMAIVDALCRSAVVVEARTPAAPSAIRAELNQMIIL